MTDNQRLKIFRVTFGLHAVVAVGLGALTMFQAGAPAGLWLRNPFAWLAGLGLAAIMWRLRPGLIWTGPLAVVVIAATFLGLEQQGVHRWIGFGPVQVNGAALVLPLAIAGVLDRRRWLNAACFALAAACLALQPDMSQLVALTVAGICYAGLTFGARGLLLTVPAAIATMAVCVGRPDPLLPVAHVEGIILLAESQFYMKGLVLLVSVALAAVSPFILWPVRALRAKIIALSAYFFVCTLAFGLGAFPVPLAGYGISYVLGWWLAVAALRLPEEKPSA